MDLLQFHRMRTAVQDNAFPGKETELTTVVGSLRDMLMRSGIFESVEVEHTDDPDQLVIALCHFKPDLSERDVAQLVERLWEQRVRYPFWEAHAVLVGEEHVEFEAATRDSTAGHYVTVHLVAQRAPVPAQRGTHD